MTIRSASLSAWICTAVLVLLSATVGAQTVVETTDPLAAPDASVGERSRSPIVYWMLIDTSGSMTEERVLRAQQSYHEVERSLRPDLDVIRVFGFPERRFAHCPRDAPASPHTGLSRPDERGNRPILALSREDVDGMRHGRGQSQTTPLWPAVAELLHEIREQIATDPRFRHRLLVVTDRGCDSEHCTARHPDPDLDDLDCDDLNEEAIRGLIPDMAAEQLLGSGVNQIAWTLVDQAAAGAPRSSLCGTEVDCSRDALGDTLIPTWRFGEVEVSVPDGTVVGLATRRVEMGLTWPIEQIGLDEIRATASVGMDAGGLLAQAASTYIAVDSRSPVGLNLPVAMNPRLTDQSREGEVSTELVLEFGSSDASVNRAERPRRTFQVTLPSEYVVVPLAASAVELVPVAVGETVRADITGDVLPLVDLLSLDGLADVADRLEVGAVAYGHQIADVQLVPRLDASALESGRLVLELTVAPGRGDEPAWSPIARRAAADFVEGRSEAMAVVLQDRNGWFHMSPIAVRDFVCTPPCDSDGTCTAECDARCCSAPVEADDSSLAWLWFLLALILAGMAGWIWSRRYPDPRGIRLGFEASTGPRKVRLFKDHSPWKQPIRVLPEEALEAGVKLKVRCLRDGSIEVRTDPPQNLRAGNKPASKTVVVAQVKGKVRHAEDLEFLDSGHRFRVLVVPDDRKR